MKYKFIFSPWLLKSPVSVQVSLGVLRMFVDVEASFGSVYSVVILPKVECTTAVIPSLAWIGT